MKNKNLFKATGIIMIAGGIIAVAGFLMLKITFGYPEIIRAAPNIILSKLYEQRNIVPYLYYFGVGGAGLSLIFSSVLLKKIFSQYGENLWSDLGQRCGVISGILLYTGIIRYTCLFPFLSKLRANGEYSKETIDLIFLAFNKYVGESIAEHAQFTFTSLMFIFFSIAIIKTNIIKKWIGILGIIISLILIYGNTEIFGLPGAFIFNRTGSKLIAVWLILSGINLLLIKKALPEPDNNLTT